MSEISRTLNFLASAGTMANTTVTGAEADQIMMQTGGTVMARGVLYNIESKRLSPSVYRLSLKRAN